MNMRDANEFLSMPVITTAHGREVGRVRDIIFDPDQQLLLGFMVAPTRDSERDMFLGQPFVRGIGRDAVTIDNENSLQPLATAPRARQVIDSGIHLKGANVLTMGGDTLGRVHQVLVDDDGHIAAYTTNNGPLSRSPRAQIAPEQVVRIGEHTIIVEDAAAVAASR
jgi:uncharacterized protein YrrD